MPRGDSDVAVLPVYTKLRSKTGSCRDRMTMTNILWVFMLVLEVFIYSSFSILVHLSKVKGHLPFKTSSVVLLIETTKLLISTSMYFPELIKNHYKLPKLQWMTCISFAIPAMLYAFNNNVALHMQLHMDPTTYQVLCNLKIATTALLYRFIIKRKMSVVQWLALGLLTLAGVCDSYGGFQSKFENAPARIYITPVGIVMMLTYCTISGLAAVYTEYILKKQLSVSLNLQNMLLYTFGIVFNGAMSLWTNQSDERQVTPLGFFSGFSIYTWLIVFSQASNGLIMSVVMKHGSNITRLFIISSAMLVTTLLSIVFVGTVIHAFFILAAALVIVAIYLYHL